MMIKQEGFDFGFNETACEKCGGKCCMGESGNIFVSADELLKLSEFFGLDLATFTHKFTHKVGYKTSLNEVPFEDGFACVFFDIKHKRCNVYALRPQQCRTFPFWEYFKTHKKELEKECVGVCF